MRLRELLADGRPVQLDGGLSTALEELGAELDDPLWTARVLRDQPSSCSPRTRRSSRAGAEIVISASYQAPDELLAESVRIARQAGVLVAASVAPYGASLAAERSTRATTRSRRAGTSAASRCCSAAEPDFLAIETQPRADEAAAIAALGRRRRRWVTFTCADGERTGHGERDRGGGARPSVARRRSPRSA